MKLVLLFAFVVVCIAQPPMPCESPKQWQAVRMLHDTKNNDRALSRYAYDELNMRTHDVEEIEQGKEKEFYETINLYKENKMYRISLRTKQCNVSTPTHPFRPRGVPTGSKFLFEVEVGPAQIPNEHLTCQLWTGNTTDGGEYFAAVTTPDCIPIRFEVINEKTQERFSDAYFNIHPGINDTSIFTPPPQCK